jgi:hypothetical protein
LTCAIVALLGNGSFETAQAVDIKTTKYIMQRTENGTIFKIGKYSEESSDSDAEDNSLVGLRDNDDDDEADAPVDAEQVQENKDHSGELYYAGSSGVRPDGSEYVRVIPD